MLVNYSSSSSSSTSGDSDVETETLATATALTEVLAPRSKRAKIAAEGETKKQLRHLLPTALSQLGTFNVCPVETSEYDDPAKHGGRIRSFKHERGNWATYVYILASSGFLDEVQEQCQTLMSEIANLELPTEDLHISLSRTVILQYHLIDSYIKSLAHAFATVEGFKVTFSNLKIYTNEEKTRTFIAFKIDDLYVGKLNQLLNKVDGVMRDYKLSQFYENPSFHISFLWCLGDKVELLNAHVDKLNTVVKNLSEHELFSLKIDEIYCKTGNKHFNFKLK